MVGIFTCLFSVCICGWWIGTEAGYSHVFTTEHFLDVVGKPGTDLVARSTVLVMYQSSCKPPFNHQHQDQHLIFLMHNYQTHTRHVWYQLNDTDSLESRLLTPDSPCLSAFYFNSGGNIMQPSATWTGEQGDLLQWYWSLLRTEISLKNMCTEVIDIVQDNIGGGPSLDLIRLQPGQETIVSSYLGYLLQFYTAKEDIVDAVFVTDNMPVIEITRREDVDVQAMKENDKKETVVHESWVWHHAARHLRNIKQPLIVQNFTRRGYQKLQIPSDLYMSLRRFYKEHKTYRYSEFMDPMNSIHQNEGMQSPQMIELTSDMKNFVADVLKPGLEAWSKTKLEPKSIYGIREYYKGNSLHNHVDRIETHVISAIMQIDQDLGQGTEDWMLEVIDFNGKRQDVKLHPGEMLYYESAKLIHGRPKPFQGSRFANVFVHFAPVQGWDFTYDDTTKLFTSEKHGVIERLDTLETELTAAGDMFRKRDEL